MFVNCASLHMIQFKFVNNVVRDRRRSKRPEDLEMNMFLKYNLSALNYRVESQQPVPATIGCQNSQKRDLRYVR